MTFLARLFRDGFALGEDVLPWGTLFEHVLSKHPDVTRPDPRWLHVSAHRLGAIETVDAAVSGPHPSRSVTMAAYGLPAAAASDAGLAALRGEFDQALGSAGEHAPTNVAATHWGSVRATSRWTLGGVALTLSSFGGVRDEPHGPTGGRLYVSGDEAALAEPFLDAFRAVAEPWTQKAGDVERFFAPGACRGPLDEAGERQRALRAPHLRRTPTWVARELDDDTVAIWRHPCGTWGIADRQTTVALGAGQPVELCLVRITRARGPGHAELEWVGHGRIVSAGPGPSGLDALAERVAREAGVNVSTQEFPDA